MNIHPKVKASAIVGAVLTVVVAVLHALTGVFPADASLFALITTAVTAVAGYLKSA